MINEILREALFASVKTFTFTESIVLVLASGLVFAAVTSSIRSVDNVLDHMISVQYNKVTTYLHKFGVCMLRVLLVMIVISSTTDLHAFPDNLLGIPRSFFDKHGHKPKETKQVNKVQCVDFSGSWTGTCKITSRDGDEEKWDQSMEIEQLGCSFIIEKINGADNDNTTLIGSISNSMMSFPKNGTYGFTTSHPDQNSFRNIDWNAERTALYIVASNQFFTTASDNVTFIDNISGERKLNGKRLEDIYNFWRSSSGASTLQLNCVYYQ